MHSASRTHGSSVCRKIIVRSTHWSNVSDVVLFEDYVSILTIPLHYIMVFLINNIFDIFLCLRDVSVLSVSQGNKRPQGLQRSQGKRDTTLPIWNFFGRNLMIYTPIIPVFSR